MQGLFHEQSRPNAASFVEVLYDNMGNFENYDKIISMANADLHLTGQNALRSSVAKYDCQLNSWLEKKYQRYSPPALSAFLPYIPSPGIGRTFQWELAVETHGMSCQQSQLLSTDNRLQGPFDWDSIMLYDSFQGVKSMSAPVMRKVSDKSTFTGGFQPSRGDGRCSFL